MSLLRFSLLRVVLDFNASRKVVDKICADVEVATANKAYWFKLDENGELVGGKVLDPESGKFYYGKIYLKNGKLVLRGSLDKRGFLGRNQEWER